MIYIKPIARQPIVAALAALLLLALAAVPARAQDGPQPRLDTVELTAGMHVIHAELAQTPQQQQIGMMFRREMGANDGMLFADSQASPRCFWMRNTLLPLSIAFIDDDGSIVNIADMQPQSDASHCSAKPVRYALEMRQGWFAKRGIKAGFKLRGAPFRP
ncbi:MAG: DUF192 domain-containing protein [Proteobacteria bacterium]|nr:DUF192 domain-containing protein [Pseudomonadota bacterium]